MTRPPELGLLARLARVILRRPGAVVLLTVVPCLFLSSLAPLVPRDLSFVAMLDMDDPIVAGLVEVNDELNLGGRLMLVVQAGSRSLAASAVGQLPQALEPLDEVAFVAVPDESWLKEQAPWIAPRSVFDRWLQQAAGTLDQEEDLWSLAHLLLRRVRGGLSDPGEGFEVVWVQMADDPLNVEMGGADFAVIERATAEALEPLGVTWSWAGVGASSAEDQATVLARLGWMTPLSLLVVLALLLFVEPRPARLLAVAAPLILALGATVGLSGLVLGGLTWVEGLFGILVFGLGVDFALHLVARLRQEQAAGAGFEEALPAALSGAGRGIVAGGLTTAGAFAVVALAPDPVARHLGVSGAIGLVVCLGLMLTLLPALWTLAERRRPGGTARDLRFGVVDRLAATSARRPWLAVAVALVLVCAAVAGYGRFRIETDLRQVFSRSVEGPETAARWSGELGVNPLPWIVVADDVEDARRVTRRFQAHPRFGRVESVATLFPEDLDERVRILEEMKPELDAWLWKVPACARDEGWFWGDPVDAYGTRMMLATAVQAGPPAIRELPADIYGALFSPASGRPLVTAWDADYSWDGRVVREQRLAAWEVDPRAASFATLFELTMAQERPWARGVLLGIGLLVLTVLLVDLRRPADVLMALAPVTVGTTVTFGALCWADVGFNVMTMISVPLLVGLGVDDGIHVVHRLRQQPGEPARAAASVGAAIAMTTVTTCAAVGVMVLSDHPGLESLALVLLVGLPVCLLASVALVPALDRLIGR